MATQPAHGTQRIALRVDRGRLRAARVDRAAGSATPSFAAGAALVFALACWFAWCAVTWHVDFARREGGSYVVRNGGLLWALFMWSAQSYRFIRQPSQVDAFTASPFWIVFALILPAPFALWGGVAMQYVLDSLSRRRDR